MKTVVAELRRQRDMIIFFVILGLVIAMGLGAALGEAVMWLWILFMTIVVVIQLRIKCPYCGHLLQMKRTDCGGWKKVTGCYSSPKIWDYCPGCHRDLTIPYDPGLRSPLDETRRNS